jgi:two-component system, sensor histidine kinase LadS
MMGRLKYISQGHALHYITGLLLSITTALLIGVPAAANEAVVVNDNTRSVKLGKYLYILEDKEKKLKIEDITDKKYSEQFQKSVHDVPYFGFTDSAYWVRLSVRSELTTNASMLIELAYPLMDHIYLYMPDKDGKLVEIKTGYRTPFSSRELKNPQFLFTVALDRGETRTLYFRFRNSDRMEIPLTLWQKDEFQKKDHDTQYVMGIYFGILFFMFAFNLLLYLTIKDRTYLYYILFILSYGFFQLIQNGYVYEYLWPESLSQFNHTIPFSIALTLLAAVQFTQSYLDIKKHYLSLYRLITALKIYLGVSVFFQFFLPYGASVVAQAVSSVVAVLLMFSVGCFAFIKGYRPAKSYLIAFSAILLGSLIYAMKVLSFLPSNFITNYAIQIGSVTQFILLSFGIGDRINLLKQEKEHAQSEALAAHEIAIENLKESARMKDEYLGEMQQKKEQIENLNDDLRRSIEELNNAYATVKLSEKRYKTLVEGSNDIVFSLDDNWNIISISNSVYAHFRMKPEKIISRNLIELIYDGDDGDISRKLVNQMLEDFSKTKARTTFRADFISPIASEPTEMQVTLEYLDIEGRHEIMGKASSIIEDTLIRCLDTERQDYTIGNHLITAEEISHRITRNLSKFFEPRQTSIIRIALREIIINAIEHGNLDITFQDKTAAMDDDNYFNLLAERQRNPELGSRKVRIVYSLDPEKLVYEITDEGAGFNHTGILNASPDEPNQLMLAHGRGIFMAREIFDHIEYNDKGNGVRLEKLIKPSA